MNIRRLLTSLLMAISILTSKPSWAVPEEVALVGGSSDAQVVLENGIIGVIFVRAVYEALDGSGRKTVYLVAEEASFKELNQIAMSRGARSIMISLNKPSLKVLVRPTSYSKSEVFWGHVVPSGEKVYVMTDRVAKLWLLKPVSDALAN